MPTINGLSKKNILKNLTGFFLLLLLLFSKQKKIAVHGQVFVMIQMCVISYFVKLGKRERYYLFFFFFFFFFFFLILFFFFFFFFASKYGPKLRYIWIWKEVQSSFKYFEQCLLKAVKTRHETFYNEYIDDKFGMTLT